MSESTGKKNDQDKPPMDLLDTDALIQIAKVMGFGAKKYSAHNWRGGLAWSRVIGAAMRHLTAFNKGEDLDPETKLPHIAHLACCAMFLLNYMENHKELDDRYKKPSIPNTEEIADLAKPYKSQEAISTMLELHQKWLKGDEDGVRANLEYANLKFADLRNANLYLANLPRADLRGANLRGANFGCADLRGANFIGAKVSVVEDLKGADIEGAIGV